ncbi:MAG TPA: chemotaxis protein CheX [Urbifossiella sp.]|jgi:CheY-specific phosphatase CheX|nr:chemotaxis protein CheX [Urbifossiella sp.]
MTQTMPPAAPPLPPPVVAAVRAATLDFLASACKMEATERPATPAAPPCPAVMGVMSFFGDPVWSFALVMPEPTAVAAANGFAGFDIPFDSPDMGDMMGEIANVIAGDIVARLDRARIKVQMSLPTVARGHDVELLPPSHTQELRLHFACPTGGFQLRLFQAVVSAPPGYKAPN